MEDRGKVNGERNLAKTSFFRPRYFLRAWKERRRQFDNATLTLEECTGERVCARRLRYICILVHSPGDRRIWKRAEVEERDHQTFRSLNLASTTFPRSSTFTNGIFSQIR